jgi:site-specific DNA-cytosine methylase
MGGGRNDAKGVNGQWVRHERDITDQPSTTLTETHIGTHQGAQNPRVVKWHWSEEWKQKHPPIELGLPCPSIIRNWHKGMPYGAVKVKQTADGLWVRRLHVLECARLQSLPDSFVFPDGLPITHAYKVIGNGWAAAHAAKFAEAMAKADPDCRTTIDLFCGGGLGACGWHGRYWSYERQERGVA